MGLFLSYEGRGNGRDENVGVARDTKRRRDVEMGESFRLLLHLPIFYNLSNTSTSF